MNRQKIFFSVSASRCISDFPINKIKCLAKKLFFFDKENFTLKQGRAVVVAQVTASTSYQIVSSRSGCSALLRTQFPDNVPKKQQRMNKLFGSLWKIWMEFQACSFNLVQLCLAQLSEE